MKRAIEDLVSRLNLQPHPEGGYFREVYRSEGLIPRHALNNDYPGDRNYCTSIYFLLTSENFSAFHRIRQDEIWHFYAGAPLYIHVIDESGRYTGHELGPEVTTGQQPQLVVPAGSWFGSSVKDEDGFTLVGCTVAPGFDFEDFELADRNALVLAYPQHAGVIQQLTRS